jgi:hypothetical protein
MSLDHDLRRAFRRKAAPDDFADRVLARIQQRDCAAGFTARGPGRHTRALRWLTAAAAVAVIAVGAARYYMYYQTIAEAERVKAEIRLALQITSEKLSLVQRRIQDSQR